MGRPTRFRLPGIPQLISQRGHNRLPCFLDGSDYSEFKQALWDSADVSRCRIHALLMLPQAYWVLARPEEEDSIARMIQRTGRCYVRHCNAKYRREGTLWAGRYQACLVEPGHGYMQNCTDYLAATPARSGMVATGTRWPWLFLDEALEAKMHDSIEDEQYEEVNNVLKMGLVLGSAGFRRKIARDCGIRTEPGTRGRPRKNA